MTRCWPIRARAPSRHERRLRAIPSDRARSRGAAAGIRTAGAPRPGSLRDPGAGAAVVDRAQPADRPPSIARWRRRRPMRRGACSTFKCQDLAWAVVDSGIDARHPAFLAPGIRSQARRGHRHRRTSRIKATYDFTRLRQLLSLDSIRPPAAGSMAGRGSRGGRSPVQAHATAAAFRASRSTGRSSSRWSTCLSGTTAGGYRPPVHDHGTHVAGIIGAVQTTAKSSIRACAGHRALRFARA